MRLFQIPVSLLPFPDVCSGSSFDIFHFQSQHEIVFHFVFLSSDLARDPIFLFHFLKPYK